MKRLFSLFALTLMAAISFSASAQSSIVGKWDAEAGNQLALLEQLNGQLEKQTSIMTFDSDAHYSCSSHIKATADLGGIIMYMDMSTTERGTWRTEGDTIAMTITDMDLIECDITFSDTSLNSMSEVIAQNIQEQYNTVVGTHVTYNMEVINNDKIVLEFDNGTMSMGFTLTRIR